MADSNDVLVHILLWTLVLYTGCSAVCNQNGWFGDDTCPFQCHCAGADDCNKNTGACPGLCDSQWFGPACQYRSSPVTSTSTWLIDNNDQTCNNENTNTVTVSLDPAVPLTWIRVVVSNSAYLNNIDLIFGTESFQSVSCSSSQFARVSDTTLDISCPTNAVVTQVRLTGKGVGWLCSLYISGGRNVALKQLAEQSSTYLDWVAANGVNGLVGGVDQSDMETSRYCTHTDGFTGKEEWWGLTMAYTVRINSFLIYNRRNPSRGGCCENRLIGFTLEAFTSGSSTPVYNYTDPLSYYLDIYTVVPSPTIDQDIQSIRIEKSSNAWELTLCEVFIFGERVCPSLKFGLECDRDCNCVGDSACFVHSGGCPAGCKAGYSGEDCWKPCSVGSYGLGCSESCSVNCAGTINPCNYIDGHCDQGCDPGYQNYKCDKVCDAGYYGQGCRGVCSVHCGGESDACDHVTGVCIQGCDPGYRSALCTQVCPVGKYGSNCSKSCSVHCAGVNNACHHVNGTCNEGCDPGYQRELCDTPCSSGFYGNTCEQPCSLNCAGEGDTCHHVTGYCLQGCDPGYTTELCNQACPRGKFGLGCSENCSIHCVGDDRVCRHTDGYCYLGCEEGYKPPLCTSVCPVGKYGAGCSKSCSVHCAGANNACHHVNGTCNEGCDPGYQGKLCDTACPSGFYGNKCEQPCSINCAGEGDTCHHVTGYCLQGCDAGYTTELCNQACFKGSFGRGCSENCSIHCVGDDRVCRHTDGYCYLGCEEGYKPPLCTSDASKSESSGTSGVDIGLIVGIVIASTVAVVAVTVLTIILWRRRAVSAERTSRSNGTTDQTVTQQSQGRVAIVPRSMLDKDNYHHLEMSKYPHTKRQDIGTVVNSNSTRPNEEDYVAPIDLVITDRESGHYEVPDTMIETIKVDSDGPEYENTSSVHYSSQRTAQPGKIPHLYDYVI